MRTAPDNRSPPEIWDEQYCLRVAQPFFWVLKADSLISAFEILVSAEESRHNPPHLSEVAYMLAGFAVEVLLKAQSIARKTPINAQGQFELKGHFLADLAENVGFVLNDDEAELFERLEQYLIWAGRYPVPLTSEPMRPRPTSQGFAPRTYHHVGADWPLIRALFERLKQPLPRVPYPNAEG